MATLTFEDWLKHLKPGVNPVFRHTRAALIDLAPFAGTASAKEIAAPVLADPLSTLRLIYSSNNRTSSRFGAEVATVEHAIMMQGVSIFLNESRGLPVLENTPQGRDKHTLASLYRLARLAQHASWQARDFGTLYHDTRAEELQIAALLYFTPEFLFWLDAPDVAEQLAYLRRGMPSVKAEEQALGFALPPLRERLLETWKIPECIRSLLKVESTGNPRQAILWAALDIAHHSRRGWWDPRLLQSYQTLSELVHMPLDEVIATVHDNAIRSARYGSWVHAAPAAAWLPMEPGEWPPDPEHKKPPKPAAVSGKGVPVKDASLKGVPAKDVPVKDVSTKAVPAKEEIGQEICLVPVRSVFTATLANIESHLDGSLNQNQMLAIILKGLHTGLGLSRVMFALVTPDNTRVKSRFTLGIPTDDPLRQFEFALANKDLFGMLMGKMQSVWVNDDNRGKLWPRVQPELRAMIGHGDFFAMSLHSREKLIGLVYADRGHGECQLDPRAYDDFKKLCLVAARGLTHVKTE